MDEDVGREIELDFEALEDKSGVKIRRQPRALALLAEATQELRDWNVMQRMQKMGGRLRQGASKHAFTHFARDVRTAWLLCGGKPGEVGASWNKIRGRYEGSLLKLMRELLTQANIRNPHTKEPFSDVTIFRAIEAVVEIEQQVK